MIREFELRDLESCKLIMDKCLDCSVKLEKPMIEVLKKRFVSDDWILSHFREYPLVVYENDFRVVGLAGFRETKFRRCMFFQNFKEEELVLNCLRK